MWFVKGIVVVAEFLRKSIFGDFRIFVVSDYGKRATLIGIIRFSREYLESAYIHPDENCVTFKWMENCVTHCQKIV